MRDIATFVQNIAHIKLLSLSIVKLNKFESLHWRIYKTFIVLKIIQCLISLWSRVSRTAENLYLYKNVFELFFFSRPRQKMLTFIHFSESYFANNWTKTIYQWFLRTFDTNNYYYGCHGTFLIDSILKTCFSSETKLLIIEPKFYRKNLWICTKNY